MKDDGVIEDYAIAGGMAIAFWVEAIPTYDLDVLVIQNDGQRAAPWPAEHVNISGVPVHFSRRKQTSRSKRSPRPSH